MKSKKATRLFCTGLKKSVNVFIEGIAYALIILRNDPVQGGIVPQMKIRALKGASQNFCGKIHI